MAIPESASSGDTQPISHTLRSGVIDDIGAMALVYERATAAQEGRVLPIEATSLTKLNTIVRRMDKPNAWAHVVDGPAGTMAGFVLGHASSHEFSTGYDPDGEFLALLMVEPEAWGKGIGGALLDGAIETARSRRKDRISLWTERTNERSHRLYKGRGYNLLDVQLNFGGDGTGNRLVYYNLDLRPTESDLI